MTNEQILNSFAQGATDGQNSGGTIFIEGDVIYSYGKHFPMARRVGVEVLLTTRTYSNTTAKQMSGLRRALDYDYIEVDNVMAENDHEVRVNISNLLVRKVEAHKKHERARSEAMKSVHANTILSIIDTLDQYAELTGVTV